MAFLFLLIIVPLGGIGGSSRARASASTCSELFQSQEQLILGQALGPSPEARAL